MDFFLIAKYKRPSDKRQYKKRAELKHKPISGKKVRLLRLADIT
jgi:hypothetical protein